MYIYTDIYIYKKLCRYSMHIRMYFKCYFNQYICNIYIYINAFLCICVCICIYTHNHMHLSLFYFSFILFAAILGSLDCKLAESDAVPVLVSLVLRGK